MSLVLAVMTVLTPAGCSSSPAEHTPTPGTLARDYFNSLTADERANLAAHGTPDDFLGSLLGAYQCQEAPSDHRGCPPTAAVTATAHRLGGTLYERTILVKHHDGHFESLPLYVATHTNGPAELIDDTGRAYLGGLNDFRAHNSMLSSADLVLLAKPFTETSGGFRLQVVTGHTPGGDYQNTDRSAPRRSPWGILSSWGRGEVYGRPRQTPYGRSGYGRPARGNGELIDPHHLRSLAFEALHRCGQHVPEVLGSCCAVPGQR